MHKSVSLSFTRLFLILAMVCLTSATLIVSCSQANEETDTNEKEKASHFEKDPEPGNEIYTFLSKQLPRQSIDSLCMKSLAPVSLLIQYSNGIIKACEIVSSEYDDDTNKSISDAFTGKSIQFSNFSEFDNSSYQVELDSRKMCRQLNYTFIKDSGQ